jgi:hypothetical protein
MSNVIKVGDIVAFNNLPDAAWFDVLGITGFNLLIREHGTDYATQWADISTVKQIKDTKPQIPEIWDEVADTWEMACPGCAHGEFLDVQAKVFVRLVEDGTDIDGSGNHDHEWDEDSICQCSSCGWSGLVEDAKQFYADNLEQG